MYIFSIEMNNMDVSRTDGVEVEVKQVSNGRQSPYSV